MRLTVRRGRKYLHFEVGSSILEAKTLNDHAAQLHDRYPDKDYERSPYWERKAEAEQRRASAMQCVI
jgi:hypothetical protein